MVQPNDNASKLAGNVPADPKPTDAKAANSVALPATADLPAFGTFGGLVPRTGAATSSVATGADGGGSLPPQNSTDPIKPLVLSPQLSPQLSQFGSNGELLIRGQSADGVSQFAPSSLLHQIGDPASRESVTDPIRPLNLLPPTSLPLGASRTGLPSAPGNPADAVTDRQKDPIRPLRLVPPSGS
jgi:hypothetical protein